LIATLVCTSALPALGDETSRSYVARSEVETAAGVARASATLSVSSKNATSFVNVASANGALVSLPTQFAADGEIMANSLDPSVTCYNMAMAALYQARTPAEQAAIFVRFGDDTIGVPVSFKETRESDGAIALTGSGIKTMTLSNSEAQTIPAGMLVDARIVVERGELSDVVFDEATVVGSPAKPVSRLTCSLTRGAQPPSAPPPAAPVVSDAQGA
jgi:hypothetical protein